MANSKFSRFVYNVIDVAGINNEIKSNRLESMKQRERILTGIIKHFNVGDEEIILTGSTSEGILPLEASDTDGMSILKNIVCVDEVTSETDNLLEILIAEYDKMTPGYIKVRQYNIGYVDCSNFSIKTWFSPQNYWYGAAFEAPLLSNKSINDYNKLSIKQLLKRQPHERVIIHEEYTGPAYTTRITFSNNKSSDIDNVLAIRFYNSSILTEWSTRTRFYDWPSEELINEVSTMKGFILPVGEKESETQHLEWRISQVTAEKTLLKAFNSSQDKFYLILKLFSKHVFSSVSKSFSSYMVKNVVLWMAEINPSHTFTPDLLISQLLQSLNFIKQCLICNHLPSYMMPKKNLIARRILGHEKRELIILLSSLSDEGAYVIYRLPKLAECLTYASIYPNIFVKAGIWRHCVEIQLNSELERLGHPNIFQDLLRTYSNGDVVSLYKRLNNDQGMISYRITLLKLTVPDHLDRPIVTRSHKQKVTNIFDERIQLVGKCFFLE